MRSFYQPLALGVACPTDSAASRLGSEPSGGDEPSSAPTAPSRHGGRSTASPATQAAQADSTTGATPAGLTIDGWACRDFSEQTGHAIGRSAQLGDLQVYVTSGDDDGPQSIPEAVQRWLLTGER